MENISIVFHADGTIHIGSYVFQKKVFSELIRYVEKGGYPEWKNEVGPQYVIDMKYHVQKTDNPFFKGVFS